MPEPERECSRPCPPEISQEDCEECFFYWKRMRTEGFWKDGFGWTDKAVREWLRA